jgi:hypothetical protein
MGTIALLAVLFLIYSEHISNKTLIIMIQLMNMNHSLTEEHY